MKPTDIVLIGGGAGLHEATVKSIDGDRAVVWWPCETYGRQEMDVPISLLIETGGTGPERYPKRTGATEIPVPRMSE